MRSECLRICACTGTLCHTAPDPVFSLSDTPPSVLVLRLEALLLVLMLLSSSSLLSFFLFLILDFKTNLSIIQPKKKPKTKDFVFYFPIFQLSDCLLVGLRFPSLKTSHSDRLRCLSALSFCQVALVSLCVPTSLQARSKP